MSRALAYPKLDFPQKLQSAILELILTCSTFIEPKGSLNVTPDPDDNILIECALAAKAIFVITGDKKLLSMKKYKEIILVSPDNLLELLNK